VRKIEITIKEDGKMTVHVVGYKGKTCVNDTEFLKDVGIVEDVKKLPQYYEKELVQKVKVPCG